MRSSIMDLAEKRSEPRPIPMGICSLRLIGNGSMLKTPLCNLFGIEVPIILTPMGTCTSAELAAAVSNAGGLGGIGSPFRTTAAVKRDTEEIGRPARTGLPGPVLTSKDILARW